MTSSSSTISPATRPRRGQTGGSGRRRPTVVPAGLFTGPQPHRAGLRQDQAVDAQRPKTKHRRHMQSSRTPHRHHRAQRVPELHPKRRIWFQLKRMRSRVRPMISAICSSPNLARSPGARFIVKAVEPALSKAPTPLADRVFASPLFASPPTRSMIALFSSPSTAARTIRARRASPWAVFRRRSKPSSSRRSASDKVIATAALLTSHRSNTTDKIFQ